MGRANKNPTGRTINRSSAAYVSPWTNSSAAYVSPWTNYRYPGRKLLGHKVIRVFGDGCSRHGQARENPITESFLSSWIS